MSETSLLKQLANRCRSFHSQIGITQTQMSKAVGMSDGNYSAFLAGNKGIGSEATCLLLKYTALSPQKAIATFSKPIFSAKILNLQENGRKLRFDNGGWTPKEGGADDPNGTRDISGSCDAKRCQQPARNPRGFRRTEEAGCSRFHSQGLS